MSKIESLEKDIAQMEDIVATLDSLLESRGRVPVIELPVTGRAVQVIDAQQPFTTMAVASAQPSTRSPQAAADPKPVVVQQPVVSSKPTAAPQSPPEKSPTVVQQPAREKKPEAAKQPKVASKSGPEPKQVVTQPSAENKPAQMAKPAKEPESAKVELVRDTQPLDRQPKDCRESWHNLKIGMTKKQVQSLMGEPDRRSERIIDYWCYITSQGNAGYIYFNEGRLSGLGEPFIE